MTAKVTSERILGCIVNTAMRNLELNDDIIIDIEDAEFVATGYIEQYKSSIARDVTLAENLEELDIVLEHQAMMAIMLSKVLVEYLQEVRRQKEFTTKKYEHTFKKNKA